MTDASDAHQASRLIQWALRTKERPSQNPEYQRLVSRHQQESSFQHVVDEVAAGLSVKVLAVGPLGVVLAPLDDSPFAFKPAEFRNVRGVEDRILDGLVQVAIAATIFPRAADLEDEATQVRPPTTIGEVEEILRSLTDALRDQAAGRPDPTSKDEEEGLVEAWRIYSRRLAARETPDGRQAHRDTRRLIEGHFDRLVDLGCFIKVGEEPNMQFQSLWRYQVLVRELAATKLYDAVIHAIGGES